MKELLNFLAGLGESVAALGTAPSYQRPQRGDRALDMRNLRSDFHVVGQGLARTAGKAVREHQDGKVHHRADQG